MSGHEDEGTGWHMHGDHGPIHPEPKRPIPRHPLPDGSLSACYAADPTCRPVVVRTLDQDAARDARVAATARAAAWQEGKDSEHTIQCRLGDGDCICVNPYDPLRAATEDPLPDG